MDASEITLTVDCWEPEDVSRRIKDRGFPIEVERMDFGDISFHTPTTNRYVGIERKTWLDLLSSVRRRQPNVTPRVTHLHHQVRGMLAKFDISIILLDGGFRPTPAGGMFVNGRAIAPGAVYMADNALLSAQQLGITIAHCLDKEALGERLMKIITWADKGEHRFGNGKNFNPR